MAINDWPEAERPREKLVRHGPGCLSDAELLAIFLRTGLPGISALDLARVLLRESGDIRRLLDMQAAEFCALKGMGLAKYSLLQAALELSKRYLKIELTQRQLVRSASEAMDYLVLELRHRREECFLALYLDSQNQVIDSVELAVGTVSSAVVYPREVVKSALHYNAVSVIFAHNHPSGRAEPSESDIQLTRSLVGALASVDIVVFDHIVIGDGEAVSFAERGLLSFAS